MMMMMMMKKKKKVMMMEKKKKGMDKIKRLKIWRLLKCITLQAHYIESISTLQ